MKGRFPPGPHLEAFATVSTSVSSLFSVHGLMCIQVTLILKYKNLISQCFKSAHSLSKLGYLLYVRYVEVFENESLIEDFKIIEFNISHGLLFLFAMEFKMGAGAWRGAGSAGGGHSP